MKAEIRRAADAEEFGTSERCYILEVASDQGDEAVSIARARVTPGVTTEWHHVVATDERYIIVSGSGRVDVGEMASAEVGPGDVVRVPAGVRQRITNVGTDDLLFYCVCTPRFRNANYRQQD